MIEHKPIFDIEKVKAHYEQQDGVPIEYVCTSEIMYNPVPIYMDIFYRETPHPEFGNRYFGLYICLYGSVMICNADQIEGQTITTITDNQGREHYSRHRHDYVEVDDGTYIDSGRDEQINSVEGAKLKQYTVTNGKLEEVEDND